MPHSTCEWGGVGGAPGWRLAGMCVARAAEAGGCLLLGAEALETRHGSWASQFPPHASKGPVPYRIFSNATHQQLQGLSSALCTVSGALAHVPAPALPLRCPCPGP